MSGQLERARTVVDALTALYFQAQQSVISEFSGAMDTDRAALLAEVNRYRAEVGLPPFPRPDYWPEED